MQSPAISTSHPFREESVMPARRPAGVSGVALIVAASAIVLVLNAVVAINQLTSSAPVTPWEAGITVEGWRRATGQPTYVNPEAPGGHATHMYGPLCSELLGRVFALTGPSNPWSRVPSLLASVGLAALLCWACAIRGRTAWFCGLSLAWGINYRTSNIFAENRPDSIAFLLAVLGVIGLSAGYVRREAVAYLIGVACVLSGFLFKQTAAVTALVFAGAVLIDGRRVWFVRAVVAVLPIAAVCAVVGAMKWTRPEMYQAVISIPSGYGIDRREYVKEAWLTLCAIPLLWVALWDLVLRGDPATAGQFRGRLILIALFVTFPTSLMARIKVGGTDNSMLPFHLAATAFLLCRLGPMLDLVRGLVVPWRHWSSAVLVSGLLILHAFPNPGRHVAYLTPSRARGAAYREAVSWVASRAGRVVSPDDPTILVLAGKGACRNLYLERDARPRLGQWQPGVPAVVLEDIDRADLVLNVRDFRTSGIDFLDDEVLESLGCRRVEANDHYSLWEREGASQAGRTARRDSSVEPPRPRR